MALTTTERLMWHCEHHTVELESAALERLISDYQHLVHQVQPTKKATRQGKENVIQHAGPSQTSRILGPHPPQKHVHCVNPLQTSEYRPPPALTPIRRARSVAV